MILSCIKNRVRPTGRTLPKATDNSDMYTREFPSGNFLDFFFVCMMSLFRLPCGKLSLSFLTVPAGKDGRVERPCQTVNDFIGVRGNVCGLFLFVQTHAPLDFREQHTMCLLLCCLLLIVGECSFQKSKVVLVLLNDLQNHITLRIIRHLLQLIVECDAETSSNIFQRYILIPRITPSGSGFGSTFSSGCRISCKVCARS